MATTPPSSDPQVTQPDTVIVGSVNQAVLQQANPTVARSYTSDFVAEKNEIIATQVKQLEATQGFPVTDSQLTGITAFADAPARFIVNTKYQDEIEAANAAQSVPANTPPPTVAPANIDAPLPTINETDPNFISNPGPVDNTIDPETPQPTVDVSVGKKSFVPIAVDNTTEPGSTSTGFDDFYGDQTFTSNRTGTADATPVAPTNTGFDNYYGEQTFTPGRTGTADAVPAANTGFDDFYGEQTFTVNFKGTADAVPAANTGFEDFYGAEQFNNVGEFQAETVGEEFSGYEDFYGAEQFNNVGEFQAETVGEEFSGYEDFYGEQTFTTNFTGTADAVPVSPTANPQVPNIFSSIGALLSSLFGIRPTPVSPAANPQVAQAFPVPAPTVFTPTPIPPAANPQVAQAFPVPAPTVTTAIPIPPVANPQVAQAFPVPAPTVLTPTPILPAANPQVPEPPIVQNYFTDATPVQPASNPQVSNPPIRVVAVSSETLLQNDPDTAREYTAFKNETAEQLTAQRIAEQEAALGEPISVSAQVQIAARAEIDATADANFRYQDQIEAAGAATVVPADTPPPIPSPTAVVNNPQVIVVPTRVVAVSSETLLQNDPDTAREYTAFKNETAEQLTAQRIAEQEAALGEPISVSAQAQIAARANIDATADANFRYQDQIEAAGAGTTVPADTPPPTVGTQSVSPDTDSQVPTPTVVLNVGGKRADPPVVDSPAEPAVQAESDTRIDGTVDQAVFQQANPAAATDYRSYVVDTQNKIVEQQTRELEASQGFPASENQIAVINGEAFGTATIAANVRFKDQIESADAAPSVPAGTPPPTIVPADVNVPTLPNDADPNFISNPGPVDSTIDPEVPSSANVRVENVFQSELAQKDPALYQQWQGTFAARTEQNIAKEIAATEAVYGRPVTDEEKVSIANSAVFRARNETNAIYQDELQAANAVSVVPTDTPPPTVLAPTVDSATNQQVPPAATGEALIDPDTGEVLGYVDTATGDVTDAPVTVSPTADPQVPNSDNSQIASVSQSQLAQSNPTLSNEYNSAVASNTAATEEQLTAQALATYGVTTASDLPLDVQLDIREQALTTGVTQANVEFRDQLEESGAATSVPTGTPPPTVAAAPPSPSPYEIFLAEEAAATTEAEAAATARFNAQFDENGDIIASSADPQAFPVTDPGDGIVVSELEPVGEEFSGYEDFYGTEEFNNVGEFQAEPVPNEFSGYDEFYGDDTGEFQDLALEPAVGDSESAGYDEFYGDDTGEFQDLTLEPAAGDGESAGYDEFYGDDTGEFQDLTLEPAAGDGESAGFGNFFGDFAAGAGGLLKSFAGAVGSADPQANSAQQSALDSISGLVKSAIKTPNQLAAERQAAAKAQAQAQAQVNAQRKQANEGDWRVRLRLAGGADYLYKAKGANGQSAAGILQPLAVTDGVIFPYTPQITTQYTAKYNPYELTHSNYKGYFYQGSSVNEISITATFTAQDTSEANYLLAVIHFFRSVTKMFYGQDDASKRGAPPPLVFLQGLGEYQFNLHPCVVSSFNYVLPADVDYIRANSVNFDGTNLLQRRDRQNLPIDYVNSVSSRLSNAGLTKGGLNTPPPPPTLGTKNPTYVPTKMEIQLILLPMQTRSQVSQQFSLKQFASGDLIRGGFW